MRLRYINLSKISLNISQLGKAKSFFHKVWLKLIKKSRDEKNAACIFYASLDIVSCVAFRVTLLNFIGWNNWNSDLFINDRLKQVEAGIQKGIDNKVFSIYTKWWDQFWILSKKSYPNIIYNAVKQCEESELTIWLFPRISVWH